MYLTDMVFTTVIIRAASLGHSEPGVEVRTHSQEKTEYAGGSMHDRLGELLLAATLSQMPC